MAYIRAQAAARLHEALATDQWIAERKEWLDQFVATMIAGLPETIQGDLPTIADTVAFLTRAVDNKYKMVA